MSQILKEIYCSRSNAVLQFLYTNIRADPDDAKYIIRQREQAEKSITRFVKSERVRAAGLLWENFDSSAWWCTFTFREDKLPPDRRKTKNRWAYFLVKLRKQGYSVVRYFRVIENKHGAGRYHYHAVMDGVPRKVLVNTWRSLYGDDVHIVPFDPSLVWMSPHGYGTAEYLVKESIVREVASDTIGRHAYSRSRGAAKLRDPTMLPARSVPDSYYLAAPPGIRPDELKPVSDSQFGRSSYLVYRAPQETGPRQAVKGGRGIKARNQ